MSRKTCSAKSGKLVEINEAKVTEHLSEIVRGTVEETLNGLLDAEADPLCHVKRYDRTGDRLDTPAGSCRRSLHTKAKEVSLKVPKFRKLPFETAIIERCSQEKSEKIPAMLKAIHAQEDRSEALRKAQNPLKKLEQMKLARAASIVREGIEERLASDRDKQNTERLMREIRRHTRVVGAFPADQHSCLLQPGFVTLRVPSGAPNEI